MIDNNSYTCAFPAINQLRKTNVWCVRVRKSQNISMGIKALQEEKCGPVPLSVAHPCCVSVCVCVPSSQWRRCSPCLATLLHFLWPLPLWPLLPFQRNPPRAPSSMSRWPRQVINRERERESTYLHFIMNTLFMNQLCYFVTVDLFIYYVIKYIMGATCFFSDYLY